jgi:hypothetical protein
MTEKCVTAQSPPYELVSALAPVLDIKDPGHFSLLYTALSKSGVDSTVSAYARQGIQVQIKGDHPIHILHSLSLKLIR